MNVSKNHRSAWFLTGAIVFLFLAFAMNVRAEEPTTTSVMVPTTGTEGIVEVMPTTMDSVVYMQQPCSCNECDPCARPGIKHPLKDNLSATTCFNCRTNGSYKFPVPRQYTYFWPGIYSQKTMTEYVAPYQGLKLRSPAEVFDSELEAGK